MTRPRAPEGWLVALEGIDGAGKSTVARALALRWRRAGLRVARWREPSDPVLGAEAQRVAPRDPAAAAVLFTLDRLYARPRLVALLARNDVVVSDRSLFSTLAYQGSALAPAAARSLAGVQRAVARWPDRVVWLRVDPGHGLQRAGRRSGGAAAPLERRATLARVARAYGRLARGRGWIVVDAERPTAEVIAAVDARLRPALRRRRRVASMK